MRDQVDCAIVGGGPGGLVLGLLLARQGVEVALLESHADFDRAFRGDTLHAPTLALLDRLGLGPRVQGMLHSKLRMLDMIANGRRYRVGDLTTLRGKHRYVGLVPQAELLALIASEAARYPTFSLRMESSARELIERDGRVVGLRYKAGGELHELAATLVVGADGRGSRVRAAAGIELVTTAPPMDIVWFTLPAEPTDVAIDPLAIRFGSGDLLISIFRGAYWQLGYVIAKSSFAEVRGHGIGALRSAVARIVPAFGARMEAVPDWSATQILAVQTGHVRTWFRPGLLLIGDAAHVMSPIGGIGINYAVQDAIAAANRLARPLRDGRLATSHLAAVQRRREWPTRAIQRVQAAIQRGIVAQALASDGPFTPPLPVRLADRFPLLRRIPAFLFGRGLVVERLSPALARARVQPRAMPTSSERAP